MSRITAQTKICMVIGDPVEHSLSPQMHNAGYEALGIEDEFVYVASHVILKDLKEFVNGFRAMHIHGASLTIPHKLEILNYLDVVDPIAKKIGAANTLINDNNVLKGYNTDWLGIAEPLKKITDIKNKHVAILGSGGAARAACYAVTNLGANFNIFNRTLKNAQDLAKEFNTNWYSLDDFEKINSMDIIINTTAIGLHPHENKTPLPKQYITNRHIVFDVVYTAQGDTRLITEAKEQGAQTIPGIEMLLHQGFAQFALFTGRKAPEDAMRIVLQKIVQ